MEGKEPNYIKSSMRVVVAVFFSLLLLGIFPEFSIGGFTCKKMDILSDVKTKDSVKIAKRNKVDSNKIAAVVDNSCPAGVECFEGDLKNSHYLTFINKLKNIKKRRVRIAWFGDSYTEGDMIVAHLRDSLQKIFGGKGVGYVPITSPAAGARPTITHSYSGWEDKSIVGKSGHLAGISGEVWIPYDGAKVKYTVPNYLNWSTLKSFNTVGVLYKSDGGQLQLNSSGDISVDLNTNNQINYLDINLNDATQLTATANGRISLYGFYLYNNSGLVIDNYALRGNSGIGNLNIPSYVYSRCQELLNYDLVVLQYGLNATGGGLKNVDWYEKQFRKLVELYKTAFPNTPILIVSVPDRGERKNGEIHTMIGVPEMAEMQQQVAIDNECMYWNLWQAMGGQDATVELAKEKFSAGDYTHVTFKGGEFIAGLFIESFMHVYNKNK